VAARWFHQKAGPVRPWYKRDSGVRFTAEQALVAEYFPTLTFRVDEKAQIVDLEGLFIDPLELWHRYQYRNESGLSENLPGYGAYRFRFRQTVQAVSGQRY